MHDHLAIDLLVVGLAVASSGRSTVLRFHRLEARAVDDLTQLSDSYFLIIVLDPRFAFLEAHGRVYHTLCFL